MKPETKVVHSGDRRKAGAYVPVTTPIYTATTYSYDSMDQLDKIFAREESGPSYIRYDNPTTNALEELINDLEGGHGTVACASGMAALHVSLLAALLDRPKRVVAANALYGSTTNLLMKVLGPLGIETTLVDICDPAAVEQAVSETKPGAIVMETISNPLLRVGPLDKIAEIAKKAEAALIVDNTFATPMLVRPLELGATLSVHSVTKYLAGHGDVLGGAIISNRESFDMVKTLAVTLGPSMSPFEAYLTMRGIKTLALRVERSCANACKIASWLASHPRVERVYFTGDPAHPDAPAIARLFPKNMTGAIVSFELKDAAREGVFEFMERAKLVVRGTSLGDVQTMMLYPAISSHRDLAPKQRLRMGIRDNLIRLSVGIEAPEDILADLEQALAK
jgi:cystathionine beta-lyase/cystathionine gamma-synthase